MRIRTGREVFAFLGHHERAEQRLRPRRGSKGQQQVQRRRADLIGGYVKIKRNTETANFSKGYCQ